MDELIQMPAKLASLQDQVAEIKQLVQQLLDQPNDLQEILGLEEVVKLTGYSKNTIYQYVHSDKIPYHKPEHGGRKLIFYRSEIEGWLRGSKSEASDEFCGRMERELHKQYSGGLN